MVAFASNLLGVGLYTAAEAAMYANVTTRVMSRWVFGGTRGDAAFQRQFQQHGDEKVVTFLDMIQALAIRAIRRPSNPAEQVPLQAIRQAVDLATAKGISYPFARRHTIFRIGREIVLEVQGEIIDASGQHQGHPNLRQVVEVYMQDIGYNPEGVANEFTPFNEDGIKISLRPDLQFGEPVVGDTGISAWTLWEACQSEGSIESAARAYGVEPIEVRVASKYIDRIQPATAA